MYVCTQFTRGNDEMKCYGHVQGFLVDCVLLLMKMGYLPVKGIRGTQRNMGITIILNRFHYCSNVIYILLLRSCNTGHEMIDCGRDTFGFD